MTRITLTAAAILLAAGTAFAGGDRHGSEYANRQRSHVGVDHKATASIHKPATSKHVIADPKPATVQPTNETWPDFNQGIWGN